mmetsp:Transcript_27582/g.53846  ORF Transcript_27582/g.53846 Transcript_27582/m.53846 type:complete len:122 (+) Transcript_27582:296-661(+)
MWPFNRLRRRRANMNVGVEVGVTEVGKKLASWPGVGIVSLSVTTKSKHGPSMLRGETRQRSDPSIPSTVAPSFALVNPLGEIGVTELRLGTNKPPICIVLSEEIEESFPCKRCHGTTSQQV